MEERIFFTAGKNRLEGLLTRGEGERAVVVTHPHPLYGGDMHNPVVETIGRVYAARGYAVLKFNFRGVGESSGSYGDGVGEQEDLAAAVEFMRREGSVVEIAGYSFGSWVAALLLSQDFPASRLIMVAPPVGMLDFAPVSTLPVLDLVVTGQADSAIAPPDVLKKLVPVWNDRAELAVIAGADHFFWGHLDALEGRIAEAFRP